MEDGVKELYKKIQKLLTGLVPENWRSIFLYASVINGKNGEMYFYYFPKKIIKSNPINCYEVPSKFGIEEQSYNKNLKKLYKYIKKLNTFSFPRWTNITIIIKDNVFTVEFKYNDLINSPYSDEQRRVLWGYKYLNIPIESMSLPDKVLIETYVDETEIKPTVYSEPLYKFKRNDESDQTILTDYNESNDENEKVINQILKY